MFNSLLRNSVFLEPGFCLLPSEIVVKMPELPSEAIALAVRAATEWIEVCCATPLFLLLHFTRWFLQGVTGKRFPANLSFRAGLEDGVLLCE